MSARQIADPNVLLQKAKEQHAPVRVLRSSSVVASREQGAVVMRPVTVLRYSAVVEPTPGAEKEEWTYEEMRPEDEQGRIDEEKTLLKKLKGAEITLVPVFRSGSMA